MNVAIAIGLAVLSLLFFRVAHLMFSQSKSYSEAERAQNSQYDTYCSDRAKAGRFWGAVALLMLAAATFTLFRT